MKPIEVMLAKRKHLARLANRQDADGEIRMLDSMSNWVPRPRGKGLQVLLAALRETGIEIKSSSFDAIELQEPKEIDFTNLEKVRSCLSEMTFIEIKTANQPRVKQDFTGFFFGRWSNSRCDWYLVTWFFAQHFCASCGSEHIRRNGSAAGHAQCRCRTCGYQARFVPAAIAKAVQYDQVDKLLSERVFQRSIVRLTGVSRMTVAKRAKKSPGPPAAPAATAPEKGPEKMPGSA